MKKLLLLLLAFCGAPLLAQQPQSQTAPISAINAKYANGVAPGYAPTVASGLTLNVSAGTANCSGTIATYAGGTLTMTASTTNYVYLDTSSSCAPAVKTTAFTASDIPIATVVAGASSITSIADDRTPFNKPSSGSGSGTVTDGSGTTTAGEIAQSTTTAHQVQYSSALPNGTTATTQTTGDNTTKVATDAFVIENAGGGGGSGTVSGQAAGVVPLGTSANAIGSQSHIDDGVTVTGDVTVSEPLNVAVSASPSQITLTPNSHSPTTLAGSAVFASDSSGNAEVSENGAAQSRICTTANGACTGGSIGAVVLISEQLLSAAAPSFTFSSIPATYRDLILKCDGRGTVSATSVNANITFNADGSTSYDEQEVQNSGIASATGAVATAAGAITFTSLPGSTSTANYPGGFVLTVLDYRNSTWYKQFFHTDELVTTGPSGSGTWFYASGGGYWRNTSAITGITVTAATGNFATGSRCSLYGSL